MLALPFNLVTMGLASFVVNIALFILAAYVSNEIGGSIKVGDFPPEILSQATIIAAALGSLVVGLVSAIVGLVVARLTAAGTPIVDRLAALGPALRAAARRHGTPLYVTDGAALEAAADAVRAAFPDPWLRAYSLKANDLPALVARLAARGFGANVVSRGEWALARRAGVTNASITFEGIGKTDADLRAAVRAAAAGEPLRWVAVESADEAAALARAIEAARRRAEGRATAGPELRVDALVRLNPSVEPETHAGLATGSRGSKFGVQPGRGGRRHRGGRRRRRPGPLARAPPPRGIPARGDRRLARRRAARPRPARAAAGRDARLRHARRRRRDAGHAVAPGRAAGRRAPSAARAAGPAGSRRATRAPRRPARSASPPRSRCSWRPSRPTAGRAAWP